MIQVKVEEKIKENQLKWEKARENYRANHLTHAEYIRLNHVYNGADAALKDILQQITEMLNESPEVPIPEDLS